MLQPVYFLSIDDSMFLIEALFVLRYPELITLATFPELKTVSRVELMVMPKRRKRESF